MEGLDAFALGGFELCIMVREPRFERFELRRPHIVVLRLEDKADELYNTGIVYLAQHQYDGAVDAFESAQAERPTLAGAAARVRQARAAAAQTRSEE